MAVSAQLLAGAAAIDGAALAAGAARSGRTSVVDATRNHWTMEVLRRTELFRLVTLNLLSCLVFGSSVTEDLRREWVRIGGGGRYRQSFGKW